MTWQPGDPASTVAVTGAYWTSSATAPAAAASTSFSLRQCASLTASPAAPNTSRSIRMSG
jgi:hypothetical protein